MNRLRSVLGLGAVAALSLTLLLLEGMEVLAAPGSNPAPTLIGVSPNQAYNYQTTSITITGADLSAIPTVTMGNVALTNVTFVDSTTITAVVPADLPGGIYSITVRNPDGQSASLANAFTILRSGDGGVGVWQTTSAMTTPRNALAAVAASKYLYALGGYNADNVLSSVERSAINPDGSLGSWQIISNMTTPRAEVAAVVAKGNVYALGGCNGMPCGNFLNSVERAVINPDGSLGSWQTTSAMMTARPGLAAAAVGDYIYAVGGGSYVSSVERAVINPDGSLGPWQFTSSMTTGRRYLAVVAAGGYLYAMGSGSLVDSVERAAINSDGSLGPWQTTASMTTGRSGPVAVADRGYLYAIAGYNGSYLSSVERTTVNPDGSLGPWQVMTNSMLTPRANSGRAAAGSHVYVLGGAVGSGYLNTVEWAALSPLSLTSMNPSAVPSDRPTSIIVTGNNFLPTPTLRLGENVALAASFVSATTLTSVVPAGLADGWYTATLTNADARVATLSSALVVDTVAPTGAITINNGAAYAASRTVTLNLSASDNGSGVTGMAFSEDGVDFSAFESYVVSKAWTLSAGGGTKIVYARFLDSAGNISAPVSDTIVLDQSPPTGSVAINGGALNTTGTNVTLVVSASAATPASQVSEMIFSNDGANWSAWQSYSAAASWMLSTGDGLKTVYAKFRDTAGNVSSAVSDTITLDTTVGTDYGFTINDGALFTNRVTVTLSIGAKSFTSEMMVSNDGGFGGAAWEPYTSRRIWQITQYGIYVLPRTVYMKFKDAAGNSSIPFQDDIILDVTAPTGSVQIIPGASASSRAAPVPRRMTTNPVGGRAKPSSIYTTYFPSILNGYPCSVPTGAANVTLRLSAADDVSGVGAMIISNRPDFYCASWEGYVISQAWYVPEGTTTVYVKFRDNAGNISAPATATVTR